MNNVIEYIINFSPCWAAFPTSFPGSLFSASLSRWNGDRGCGCSRDHLSIQNRRVGGYSSTFGQQDDKIPHPSSRFLYHPDSGWSRDQPQPGSLFQTTKGGREERTWERGCCLPGEKSLTSVGGANIWRVNHQSCHLPLHWSRGNTQFIVTNFVTLYYKKDGVGLRYSWKEIHQPFCCFEHNVHGRFLCRVEAKKTHDS